MREKYSSGFSSPVFKLSLQEKQWFPQAQLVREDRESDRLWFARLFYRHKIAHLLFPNNFIDVVGAQVEPCEQELYDEFKVGCEVWRIPVVRTHRLFSKETAVSPDHAVYSDHMKIVPEDGWLLKKSICLCSICSNHRQEHSEHQIEERARRLISTLRDIGIGIDCKDSSDFCLTNNNIIFFEIGNFDEDKLKAYLEGLKNPIPNQRRASVLLNRHEVLLSMSRKAMLTRKGNSIRLN